MFSNVWSENTALFERLMAIHSNPPILYYGFKSISKTVEGENPPCLSPPPPPRSIGGCLHVPIFSGKGVLFWQFLPEVHKKVWERAVKTNFQNYLEFDREYFVQKCPKKKIGIFI